MAYELKAIVAANQAVRSGIKIARQLGIHLMRRVPIDYSTYIPLLCRVSCRVVRRINRFAPLRPKPQVHSVTFLLRDGELSPRTFSRYSDVVSTLLITAASTGLRPAEDLPTQKGSFIGDRLRKEKTPFFAMFLPPKTISRKDSLR
jgi:hypothetical protein